MRLTDLRRSLPAGLLLLTPFFRLAACSPAVNVGLKASWNGAPFLLELLETAADEDPTSYYPLLDRIASGEFSNASTDHMLYTSFLHAVREEGFLSTPEELASFNLALSIHAAAPRIEAHYHYYENTLEPRAGKLYSPDCEVWLQWSHKQVCKTTGDYKSMVLSWERYANERRKLPFDRVMEPAREDIPTAILYADIRSSEFKLHHDILRDYATAGKISYRVRHRPPIVRESRPIMLSGYGVELALKKTDYIVMDDREDASEPTGEAAEALEDNESQDIPLLQQKDISFLGTKAASFIMSSSDPFSTLLKLTQDFPKHASRVAATELNDAVMTELRHNWEAFSAAGQNTLWINGAQVEERQMNAFALLEMLRGERRSIRAMMELGLTSSEVVKLLSHQIIADSKQMEVPQRYNYRDAPEGGGLIIWLNDLEKDKRYREWSTSMSTLLRRIYPGQLHQLRKNVHNLVLPVDFASREDLTLITEQLRVFVERKIAIRFGLVPLTKTANSIAQAKVFYHLKDSYGLGTALGYLDALLATTAVSEPSPKAFEAVLKDATLRKEKPALTLPEIAASAQIEEWSVKAKGWCARLKANSEEPPVFINGLYLPRNEGWVHAMSARLQADVQVAQRAVYAELVTDDSDIAELLLEGAVDRRNEHIIPEDETKIALVNTLQLAHAHASVFGALPRVPTDQSSTERKISIWVVGDFDEKDGYQLLQGAAQMQKGHAERELLFLNNAEVATKTPALSTALYQLQQAGFFTEPKRLEKLLAEMKTGQEKIEPEALLGAQSEVKEAGWSYPDHIATGKFWEEAKALVAELGFKPGQRGLVINGRVIGPIPVNEDFVIDDWKQLLSYEESRRITPILQAADDLHLTKKLSGRTAELTNLVSLMSKSEVLTGLFENPAMARTDVMLKLWKDDHTVIESGDSDRAMFQIVASVDPASEVAQKMVPILKVLSEMEGVWLRVYLNPQREVKELPVKRFYLHVLESAPSFDDAGSLVDPKARFENIPEVPLLSLSMDVPPSWLVNPEECIYDLDNLKLESLKDRLKGADVEALYQLRSILIEGHSQDVTAGGPPKGAQLMLGTVKEPRFADTIVMANLGYFQFKANPGFWKMELKEGRSAEIFNIDSMGKTGGYSTQKQEQVEGQSAAESEITLMSFQGATLFPRLSRKVGMEGEDVLEASTGTGSVVDFAAKMVKKAEDLMVDAGLLKSSVSEVKQADINIFSVASGHLYERFLNIMMLSVMRHTDKTVKFWFIENFLSPSFKDFLPTLAEYYRFEYELVTYKWPHWLRAQKEKQREIWGYKILFLDVLFPLDLDKVIFVDADQIVRTDMKDLVDLDLEGAPYGFTPMCDSREEIEGFRFWKQGYWKSFLKGMPYHISALYVVDLKRFRQLAAGDRLRGQYHQLSADPGSLANLDQDLPNHMQSFIPIHSLPQDWLWCETWCSDESLKTAKTIDLCNNPMTKEPKLDRARRQVPEWNAYDTEVSALARNVKQKAEAGELARNSKNEVPDAKQAARNVRHPSHSKKKGETVHLKDALKDSSVEKPIVESPVQVPIVKDEL